MGGGWPELRLVEPDDAADLQEYFRSLSVRSRSNRFLGALSELSPNELDRFVHPGRGGGFSIVAVINADGFETIVGEARYAFTSDAADFEFGLSVDDEWQGRGIGTALVRNLECRASILGAKRLFGDTLRSNTDMMGLARNSGFAFAPSPGDWKLVRFEKHVGVLTENMFQNASVVSRALAVRPTLSRWCEESIPAASAA